MENDDLSKQIMIYSVSSKAFNEHLELNRKWLTERNLISVFDSTLTRILKLEANEITRDLIIVKMNNRQMTRQLFTQGFSFQGEKYIYLCSSAGQIKSSKTVFIRQEAFEAHKGEILCGLSWQRINSKGGIIPNKYIAYTALTASATKHWNDFNIDNVKLASLF